MLVRMWFVHRQDQRDRMATGAPSQRPSSARVKPRSPAARGGSAGPLKSRSLCRGAPPSHGIRQACWRHVDRDPTGAMPVLLKDRPAGQPDQRARSKSAATGASTGGSTARARTIARRTRRTGRDVEAVYWSRDDHQGASAEGSVGFTTFQPEQTSMKADITPNRVTMA